MGLCLSRPSVQQQSVVILRKDSEDHIVATEIINPTKEEVKVAKYQSKILRELSPRTASTFQPEAIETIERYDLSNYNWR